MLFNTKNTLRPTKPTHPVVVILPVYRDVEMTKRAILSAMDGVLGVVDAQLLAINDASPDSGMQEMLKNCALQWPHRVTVLKNNSNMGFVKTVNRGLDYFAKYDAVLLNSDVVVANDWLKRLIAEAYQKEKVATVTPFSNNATICSFPYFLHDNDSFSKLATSTIDQVFQETYLPCIEAPTGVGFCMYIRRAILDEIGSLNFEKFGRGYGEENDLCQRAIKNGWQNLISPNIYAHHEGEISFADDKQALVENAMQVIDALHPNYHADVQKFIKLDPLKSARVTRYIQLVASLRIPKVLHISHGLGGGITQHIEELGCYFSQSMIQLVMEAQGNTSEITLRLAISNHADALFFNMQNEYSSVIAILKTIDITCVHFHHTLGHDPLIFQLPRDLGVPHLVTVHDFYWLAGNPTLTDENGKYPGYYSDTLNNPLYPLPKDMSLESFRKPLSLLFSTAKSIIFPSYSTKNIFCNIYRLENTSVAPHLEITRELGKKLIRTKKKSDYSIGVLGALSKEKGADLLEQLAAIAQSAKMPYHFKLLGYAYKNLANIETTGPYEAIELTQLIQQHKLDIIFFPAQWPETYSYTLSYALASALPIIAPDTGAFSERLSGRASTLLFTPTTSASELNRHIENFITNITNGAEISAKKFADDNDTCHNFYQQDYLDITSSLCKTNKPQLDQFQLENKWLTKSSAIEKLGWKERVLAYLWQLYMLDSLQWIVRLIPFGSRRLIKRYLSHKPLHDIIKTSDKE